MGSSCVVFWGGVYPVTKFTTVTKASTPIPKDFIPMVIAGWEGSLVCIDGDPTRGVGLSSHDGAIIKATPIYHLCLSSLSQ